MSFYIINCSNKEINYNFDKVIIGKKIINDTKSAKYYIYYQEDEYDHIKDIYIKLPKIRTIYKLGENKFYNENISIYPNYDLTNNFINFIKQFEFDIKECFINKFPNIELNSIINKKNNIHFLKTHIDSNLKIINNNINITDIQRNSEIEIIIKINYIWNKDNIIGLNTDLFQISYTPIPKEININQKPIENNFKSNIIKNDLKLDNDSEKIEIPILNKPRVPSIADLNFAIRKLKPLTKSD